MAQLAVHALLVKLYAQNLVSEDEAKAPVWLGKAYQLQRQTAATSNTSSGGWQLGHWRALSSQVGP